MFAAFLVAAMAVMGCEGGAGPEGPPGKDGSNGSNGQSCTLTNNGNGTSTITCPGGTSVTVPTGGASTSCTVVTNTDGTRTINCSDGTSVVVTNAVVDYLVMTADELKASAMVASLSSIAIPADGRPVIKVKVSERHGLGVKNLLSAQPDATHPNPLLPISWRFALLKLEPNNAQGININGSSAETWVSYMAGNTSSATSTETATPAGFTDNGDGTYTYKFTQVVTGGTLNMTYEPSVLHRLVILMSGPSNPFSPINVVRDFTPSSLPIDFNAPDTVTGSHEKFDGAACLECHTSFRAIADGTGAFGSGEFHRGGRYDTRTCVACHNDQARNAVDGTKVVDESAITGPSNTWSGNLGVVNGEAVLNLPVFIHKIHRGEDLALKGGTYYGFSQPYETTYPQDIRNCTKCHRTGTNNAAPMADKWTIPSRRACGACHDDVTFLDPLVTQPPGRRPHTGGPLSDDRTCLTCHAPGSIAGVAAVHVPVSPPNPNNIYLNPATGTSNTNAAWVAANGVVPPGAKQLTYEVQSVGLNGARNPQITFRILEKDTPASTPFPVKFQTFGGSVTEMIPSFVGSPSAYFVYSIPQDGIAKPADFNVSASGYLRSLWNGSATGTLVEVDPTDPNHWYTVTLTGHTVPTGAAMLTGGIGYTYSLGSAPSFANNTQPFTQIDVATPVVNGKPKYQYTPNATLANPNIAGGTGGLIVPAPDVSKLATSTATDTFTARRAIVDNTKCASCHVTLGVGPDFHAGQRNDAPTCSFCHRPNQTSSAWSANAKDFIHGIHASGKRSVKFNWHAPSATDGYYNVTYPAILNRCEMCHLPGTYDFSLASTTSALPNMLPSTVGTGKYDSNQGTNPTGYFSISPYVTSDATTDYGFGFSTANVTASLPDGVSGTQQIGGVGPGILCTTQTPCLCTAANPCSLLVNGPVVVNGQSLNFNQKIGAVTNACNSTTSCTCTTSQPCTSATQVTCSLTAPCNAQARTLVNSPIAAACVACHDTPSAVDHMQTNGASIWEMRVTALNKPQKEECLICHGPNRLAGISLVHTDKTP